MSNMFFSYFPGKSLIHELDPRTKLLALFLFSILVFASQTLEQFLFIFICFLFIAFISKTKPRVYWYSLRPLIVFFLLIFIMQLLFTDGNEIISFINTSVTYEGLYLGLTVISRFVFLILFATVLTSTTRPSMITNGIERILRPLPLKYMGISSHELATMMSLSIRFIPELFENAKEIKDAQVSRGMDPSRSFLKSISSISIPLVSNSLNYVEELVIAMENRCFQGQERTNLYELKMDKSDWISLLILCSLLISYLYFT